MLTEIVDTNAGSIMISVIIGLGLASFFRKICKDGRCIIIKGPDVNDITQNVYKLDNECYKYTPTTTKCTDAH
jgi:hypothetical protein